MRTYYSELVRQMSNADTASQQQHDAMEIHSDGDGDANNVDDDEDDEHRAKQLRVSVAGREKALHEITAEDMDNMSPQEYTAFYELCASIEEEWLLRLKNQ